MTALGARSFAGGVTPTTLTSDPGASGTTLNISTVVVANWPNLSVGPFIATINRGQPDEEQVEVTAMTTGTMTVVRGQNGTPGQSHAVGATVTHTIDAGSTQDVNRHVYDTSRNDHTQYQLALSAGYGIAGLGAETPAVALTTAESFIGSNVSISSIANIGSLSLGAGTWDVTARVLVTAPSSSGGDQDADIWIGPNSASITGVFAAASGVLMPGSGNGPAAFLVLRKIVTLVSPTTVYLNGVCGAASSVAASNSLIENIGNLTGITAVRIA